MLGSILIDEARKEKKKASVQAGLHHKTPEGVVPIGICVVCAPCELHILVGNTGSK